MPPESRAPLGEASLRGKPRAIFFGSPEFAVPCLEVAAELCEVVLVVCQPDRPAGRGLALRKPAVKVRAEELGLPIAQPTKVRTDALAESLRALRADVGIVVAYGRILPKAVLEAPRVGCVNVHASLLPRWRGAAPIQWSIVAGERETGVTLMQMDEGLDTGPILQTTRTPIGEDETAGELFERLAVLGAMLLRETLPPLLAGELEPRPQDDALATLAPLLQKSDGAIDWSQPAQAIHDRIRGLSPWPGAYTTLGGKRVRIHRASVERDRLVLDRVVLDRVVLAERGRAREPGALVVAEQHVWAVCGEGLLALHELQEDGRKRLDAASFVAGKRLDASARFEPGEATRAP